MSEHIEIPRDAVLAFIGPTAAGKTRISFELAKQIGAEIISVDSRQVYRYLDVGTDKISQADRRVVPHHLIDVADPDEVFTAADFVAQAEAAIARIRARGQIPLLAGGTPMYYRALEGRVLSEALPRDDSVRAELEAVARDMGAPYLHEQLSRDDPASAAKIHPNDALRIVRAMEIARLTGMPASEVYAERAKIGGAARFFYAGIYQPSEVLYSRIETRVREQFASGYLDEVEWLLGHGYSRDLPAMQGFGYRELVRHIDGEISFEEAIVGDIRATKAFSRRQMTWFRQFSPIIWYDVSKMSIDEILDDLRGKMTDRWSS